MSTGFKVVLFLLFAFGAWEMSYLLRDRGAEELMFLQQPDTLWMVFAFLLFPGVFFLAWFALLKRGLDGASAVRSAGAAAVFVTMAVVGYREHVTRQRDARIDSLMIEARGEVNSGEYAAALEPLGLLILERPRHSWAYGLRALCLVSIGRTADGLKDAGTALRLWPDEPNALLARCVADRNEMDWAAAVPECGYASRRVTDPDIRARALINLEAARNSRKNNP